MTATTMRSRARGWFWGGEEPEWIVVALVVVALLGGAALMAGVRGQVTGVDVDGITLTYPSEWSAAGAVVSTTSPSTTPSSSCAAGKSSGAARVSSSGRLQSSVAGEGSASCLPRSGLKTRPEAMIDPMRSMRKARKSLRISHQATSVHTLPQNQRPSGRTFLEVIRPASSRYSMVST